MGTSEESTIIKKYANRRLYNTATSSYVTLDHLCQMVKDGEDFTVIDAKSGEDITHSVLTQIIFEEEAKGQNLLPVQFLKQLIQFYGDSMQSYVPGYLQISLEQFAQNQQQFRDTLTNAMGGQMPFQQFEEQIRQNMTMFEQAMQMFTPFGNTGAQDSTSTEDKPTASNSPADEIANLQEQIMAMQAKLNELAKKE